MGFIGNPPSSTLAGVNSRHFERSAFGRTVPPVRSCSVHEVSHLFDGFLHQRGCGFVAPRSRSWGSSRFRSHPSTPKSGRRCSLSRDAVHTLQRFSLTNSRTASPQPLPPWGSCHPTCTDTRGYRRDAIQAHAASSAHLNRAGEPAVLEATRGLCRAPGGEFVRHRSKSASPTRRLGELSEVPSGLHGPKTGSRVRAPPSTTRCRDERCGHKPPTRHCSIHESVSSTVSCHQATTDPFLGFVPLQGTSSRLRPAEASSLVGQIRATPEGAIR